MRRTVLCRIGICLLTICLVADVYVRLKDLAEKGCLSDKVEARMLNPVSPPRLYIADPEVRQMPDDRENTWCSNSYHVLSTSDLVHWDVE
ncbi:hypothetical protein [Phocaeicola sp.]|uniref:hypothetical protein n=1 Tax=Phocaeicola sp. TaxID=2773926 RepID=UPI0023CE17DC|nr:hypothetical protein [Phocaeicola sp.]MDE5677322.1 hypothetical protein [Phocaeicola sp.]